VPLTTTPDAPTLRPTSGCGTLESPWTGWEAQIEARTHEENTFRLVPGFYGVSRPVRLADGVSLIEDPGDGGRAWFLPVANAPLESLFEIEGRRRVRLSGVCFNGRGTRARHGIVVHSVQGLEITRCRFEDFADVEGGAILVDGVPEFPAREIVVQSCSFLHGSSGLRLGRNAADLLVVDNRFEEISGSSLWIDPRDEWADYGLIFVQNRVHAARGTRTAPFVTIRPGAEGIRIAENTLEAERAAQGADLAAIEVRGGGPRSRRRLELMVNRVVGVGGPAIRARQCGPGFAAAGNEIVACGNGKDGSIDLVGCHGILVEDNRISEPSGAGIRAQDCSGARLNGNEVEGGSPVLPRGGSVGLLVEGEGSARLRLTDNRVSAVREDGLRIGWCKGLRVVGNEVEDCGRGILVQRAHRLLLVGNDCRDNGQGGIRIDRDVHRGLVALNYAILNGTSDLEVLGERIRCRSNKVDRESLAGE
jgi:parallel beta-helix repeat protein